MRHRVLSLLSFAVPIIASIGVAADAKPTAEYKGKVSALKIAADSLGDDWTGPTGLVIADFHDLGGFPPEERSVVEEIKKQVSPVGVIAVADFTYRKKSDPLHQITLRIFLFDSERSCRDWWQKKYRFEGWDELYSAVRGVPYDAVDSKQMTKRTLSLGNLWMTCGNLKKSGDHLKLLDLAMEKVKAAAGSK